MAHVVADLPSFPAVFTLGHDTAYLITWIQNARNRTTAQHDLQGSKRTQAKPGPYPNCLTFDVFLHIFLPLLGKNKSEYNTPRGFFSFNGCTSPPNYPPSL